MMSLYLTTFFLSSVTCILISPCSTLPLPINSSSQGERNHNMESIQINQQRNHSHDLLLPLKMHYSSYYSSVFVRDSGDGLDYLCCSMFCSLLTFHHKCVSRPYWDHPLGKVGNIHKTVCGCSVHSLLLGPLSLRRAKPTTP